MLNGLFNTRRGTRDLYRDTIINQLRRRYQTVAFERMRRNLDPNNILMNPTIEAIFADQETEIDHKSDWNKRVKPVDSADRRQFVQQTEFYDKFTSL